MQIDSARGQRAVTSLCQYRYVDCITNVVNVTSLTDVIVSSCICINLCKRCVDISCDSGVIVNGVFDISWVFITIPYHIFYVDK